VKTDGTGYAELLTGPHYVKTDGTGYAELLTGLLYSVLILNLFWVEEAVFEIQKMELRWHFHYCLSFDLCRQT
jgi:hypothetical protein